MTIRFVFDYRSIYSYLANTQMSTLGVPVDYQVVDIVAIMHAVNNQPSPLCPPKLRYALIDARRWAERHSVPLIPNSQLLDALRKNVLGEAFLSRVALAAQQLGCFHEVNNALFSAVWANSDSLLTKQARDEFASSRGLNREIWELADSNEIATQLAANNERAIANDVFGAPTFFLEGEIFFGNDRLELVRERLAQLKAKEKK